jgi:Galactose oxidase-like, Early set domain/Bacterial Ig-like domain (group 1)/Kelch motif
MTRSKSYRLALAIIIAAGALRCGDNGSEPRTASSIEKAGGDGQVGLVGQPLASPLVVLVTDQNGDPVEGVEVRWAAQGGGTVGSPSSQTDSDGRASVTRVLGGEPGEQTTTASVSGLQGSPLTFVATAMEEGGEDGLVITTNPPVEALDREVFDPAAQPAVMVTTGGSPAAGVEVTASLASGSGSLEGTTTATTDASGVARFLDLGIAGSGQHTLEFTAGELSVTASPVDVVEPPAEATSGEWGPVVAWDIVPLHMNLMPNGKILAWGKTDVGADTMGMPRLWDPASGAPEGLPMISVDTMLFCSGHVLMPDGRLMVAGGHLQDDRGIATTYFFDQSGAPQRAADMVHGRWYPTLTVLPDGAVLSMAGRNEAGTVIRTPEIWEGNQWAELPGADGGAADEIPYYPRNFVAPNGLVFYAGERVGSRWFDVDGTGVGGGRGSWSNGPNHVWEFNRDYGTAVMYEPGKILYAGGGGNMGWLTPDPKASQPTATAEIIDLNDATPQWRNTEPMSVPRRHLNSTILPDGQVLITGGTRGAGFVDIDEGQATRSAEVWNPETGTWATLASNQVMRVYHSVSLLMPNGTVLHGASGDAMAIQPGGGIVPVPKEPNHEIFSPPYLFKGARPSIASMPATVSYGQVFSITTPNVGQITDVRWIRLGSVTHAFDMGQRANTLEFTPTAVGVEVTAPANPNPGSVIFSFLAPAARRPPGPAAAAPA